MSPGLRAEAYNGIGPNSCWLARGQPIFLSKATHNAQVDQSRWKLLAVCEKKKHTPMFMGWTLTRTIIVYKKKKKKKKKKKTHIVSFLVV